MNTVFKPVALVVGVAITQASTLALAALNNMEVAESTDFSHTVKDAQDRLTVYLQDDSTPHLVSSYQLNNIEDSSGNVADSGILSVLLRDQYVEVRVNEDARAVTEEIVPEVAESLNMDQIHFADQTIASGTMPGGVTVLLACHNSSARWELNMNDIEVELPIDAQSLLASIRDNNRVNTDIDLNGFELEFELQFDYPKNVGGFYCDTLNGGHDINLHVNVNVNDLTGEFDVKLDDGSNRVQIDEIKKFDVEVGSLTFDSGFLTDLTNMGVAIYDLFGGSCSDLTDCLNQEVNRLLSEDDELVGKLEELLNETLDVALTVSGGTNVGDIALDYEVGLHAVETDNSLNHLNTKWQVDFESDNFASSCMDRLAKSLFLPNNNLTTHDDFDVVFPFKTITDLMYTATKQLDLCPSFVWQVVPGVNGQLTVKPAGAYDIESVSDNILTLSLPLVAVADQFIFASGEIDLTAELTVEIKPSCGAGFELEVLDVELADISGTITWELWGLEYEMDPTDFLNDVADAVEDDIMSDLGGPIVILPESLGLEEAGHFVSVGDIDSNSSAIVVGLNVLGFDPNCH